MSTTTNYQSPSFSATSSSIIIKYEIMKKKQNSLTPWARVIWRWWCVLSRGCRSLTAPRSRVIISLPMAVYPCLCIRLSGCDWWHQRKRVFGGGEASLATSDEVEPRVEEEEVTVSASLFLPLLIPPHSSSICPVRHQSAPPPVALRAPAPWTLWWRCL